MATAVESSDFVALLIEKMYIGKDKESGLKKHKLTFTKIVFDEPKDRIPQKTFLYFDDEPDLKTGLRYSVNSTYDTDEKHWVVDHIDADDTLTFEAKFVSAHKWRSLKTKKSGDAQMWKLTLRECQETDNEDNKPWPRSMTFFYTDDDGDEIKTLKKNTRYEFDACYDEEEKAWEIQTWDDK